jgi:hypothetical protein
MKLIFCRLGWHWRMKIVDPLFVDIVSGSMVYSAVCPCGRKWMVDVTHGFPMFKVELPKRS